jgi:hypothetical protein
MDVLLLLLALLAFLAFFLTFLLCHLSLLDGNRMRNT